MLLLLLLWHCDQNGNNNKRKLKIIYFVYVLASVITECAWLEMKEEKKNKQRKSFTQIETAAEWIFMLFVDENEPKHLYFMTCN